MGEARTTLTLLFPRLLSNLAANERASCSPDFGAKREGVLLQIGAPTPDQFARVLRAQWRVSHYRRSSGRFGKVKIPAQHVGQFAGPFVSPAVRPPPNIEEAQGIRQILTCLRHSCSASGVPDRFTASVLRTLR